MSWAEVKKINSNLDVPLDALLDKKQCFSLYKIFQYDATSQSATILSVNNKCLLRRLYVTHMSRNDGDSSNTSQIRIIIKFDNNTYYDITPGIPYSNYGTYGESAYFGRSDELKMMQSSGNYSIVANDVSTGPRGLNTLEDNVTLSTSNVAISEYTETASLVTLNGNTRWFTLNGGVPRTLSFHGCHIETYDEDIKLNNGFDISYSLIRRGRGGGQISFKCFAEYILLE